MNMYVTLILLLTCNPLACICLTYQFDAVTFLFKEFMKITYSINPIKVLLISGRYSTFPSSNSTSVHCEILPVRNRTIHEILFYAYMHVELLLHPR